MNKEYRFEDEAGFCLIGNIKDICTAKDKYICGDYQKDEDEEMP